MTTQAKHDTASIALDARRVLEAVRQDAHHKEFSARLTKHEADAFERDIDALEAGDASRTTRHHAQVAAAVHVAEARASIIHLASDIRDDIKIHFSGNTELHHEFSVGMNVSGGSTSEVRALAHVLLDAAHAHPAEAKKVGLDTHGVHDLERLIHALDGADHAHISAATNRHDSTITTLALQHAVLKEAAHLRLIARRVFKDDPKQLARYESTLPRHAITPRKKPAPTPTP